jgi:hypothetical protein
MGQIYTCCTAREKKEFPDSTIEEHDDPINLKASYQTNSTQKGQYEEQIENSDQSKLKFEFYRPSL